MLQILLFIFYQLKWKKLILFILLNEKATKKIKLQENRKNILARLSKELNYKFKNVYWNCKLFKIFDYY